MIVFFLCIHRKIVSINLKEFIVRIMKNSLKKMLYGVVICAIMVNSTNVALGALPAPPPPVDYYVRLSSQPSSSYNLLVTIGQTSINLNWKAYTNSNPYRYYIYVDGSLVKSGTWSNYYTISYTLRTDYQDAYKQVKIKFTSTSGDYISDYVNVNFVISSYDSDNDGISNSDESQFGYSPYNPDSDGDGLIDGSEDYDNDGLTNVYELYNIHTNPKDFDSDDDSLSDGLEVNTLGTNPKDTDTDDDGLSDSWEYFNAIVYHTSPTKYDTDNDGLSDSQEIFTYHTTPWDYDSDDDGLSDGAEILTYGTNPKNIDTDNDGLNDYYEITQSSTDPTKTDTDNDGLNDNYEISTSNTDPNDWDSDDDGLCDGTEVNTVGTDPNNDDTDEDQILDGDEVNGYDIVFFNQHFATIYSNPLTSDSDNDGLDDYTELILIGNDYIFEIEPGNPYEGYRNLSPTNPDSDGDTILDGDEYSIGTHPGDPDTDNDGIHDDWELLYGLDPLNSGDAGIDLDFDGLTNLEEFLLFYYLDQNYNPLIEDSMNPTISDGDLDADGDGIINRDDDDVITASDPDDGNPISDNDLLGAGVPQEVVDNIRNIVSSAIQTLLLADFVIGDLKTSLVINSDGSFKILFKFPIKVDLDFMEFNVFVPLAMVFTPNPNNALKYDISFEFGNQGTGIELVLSSMNAIVFSYEFGIGINYDDHTVENDPFQVTADMYFYLEIESLFGTLKDIWNLDYPWEDSHGRIQLEFCLEFPNPMDISDFVVNTYPLA